VHAGSSAARAANAGRDELVQAWTSGTTARHDATRSARLGALVHQDLRFITCVSLDFARSADRSGVELAAGPTLLPPRANCKGRGLKPAELKRGPGRVITANRSLTWVPMFGRGLSRSRGQESVDCSKPLDLRNGQFGGETLIDEPDSCAWLTRARPSGCPGRPRFRPRPLSGTRLAPRRGSSTRASCAAGCSAQRRRRRGRPGRGGRDRCISGSTGVRAVAAIYRRQRGPAPPRTRPSRRRGAS